MSEEIALATVAELRAALDAERTKCRTIEWAVRAWADDRGHPFASACATCTALYELAQGTYADPLLAELNAARAVVAAARDAVNGTLFEARGLLVHAVAEYDWALQGVKSDA
jgi:hypothetical protein